MRTKEQTRLGKIAVLEAIEKCLGIITQASKKSGIGRDSIYRWKKEDEEFNAAMESIDNIVLDFAESALHKQINEGNTASTIFLLKCKGKKRGYIEKTEVEHSGEIIGAPVITFSDTTKPKD